MALETGTYISDLVSTNPTSTDQKSFGDDHIRLLKSAIKTTFPNVAGAVTASHTELSLMHGLTAQPVAVDGSNLTTPALGDSSTKPATTAFVAATALAASLPAQTGQAGNFITTNGTVASWKQVYPSVTGNNGKFLTTDGTNTSWASPLPAQTGLANGTLLTNGSAPYWGQAGFTNLVVITATQSWTAPAWVTKAEVTVIDGGRGGTTGFGGQGGDSGVSIIQVSAGTAYTATIGAGAPGITSGSTNNLNNGKSSFAGSGLTTLTTSNAQITALGGSTTGMLSGGTLLCPNGSPSGYGIGGAGGAGSNPGANGSPGVIVIRY